ncbi:hypothetical protein MYX65_06310 [Acidobacteria bacterium AH-259-L09]|nr:hypothetical protein [Acidobacteria bacterium AH-259-L09]
MALLIAPVLFICAVLYVAYPLLRETKEIGAPEHEKTDWEKTVQEKEDVVEALKDIDMDFRMGKLSRQDYQSLQSDFEQQAVEIFKRLGSLHKKGGKPRKKKKF